MEKVSQYSQLAVGVSINTTGSLQTSVIPSPVIPRTSQNLFPHANIAFTQAPKVTQVVLDGNSKNDAMQMKYLTNGVQPQPVILGNVNAANILSAALTNRSDNSIMLPAEMMGISSGVNSNSLIGIVPVFIQQGPASGGWLQQGHKPAEIKNNSPMIISQDIGCVSSAGNIRPPENNVIPSQNLQQPVKIVSTSEQRPVMSSSDTVILHRLSSQDTIKLSSVPSTSQSNVLPLQNMSSLNSSLSLLSNISDRSVSLTSIPTMSLFSSSQNEITVKETTPSVPYTSTTNRKENVSDNPSLNNSEGLSELTSQPFYYESEVHPKPVSCGSRKSQDRLTESEPRKLEIDESTDTDTEVQDYEPSKDKENTLTKSDTVILIDESSQKKANTSAMRVSDTVILPDSEKLNKTSTLSSDGFNVHSINAQSSGSSTEAQGNIHPSTNLNSVVAAPNTNIRLDSLLPMPNIILTDSIVNGTYNPNILCGLLSQTGTIQQASFFSNVALDQVKSENFTELTELTPVQPNCSVSTVQMNLPEGSQGTDLDISDAFNSSSVKGTQTDWMFGNASVYLKPVTESEVEYLVSKDKGSVDDSSTDVGNISSAVVLKEGCEDIINGPLILDDQAVPTSVLNLIPHHMTLLNSTANMHQPGGMTYTTVDDGIQSDNSKPLFTCTKCDQAFLTKRELQKHLKGHRKVLKCELCTSTFTTVGNYTRHRKIHNLQLGCQNVFTCEFCNRDFLQRCDLRRHMLIHTKQEPHRCDICDKGYIRRSDLVVHLRFHNREKAYKCSICNKSFFQSGDLSRHIRKTHKPSSLLTCGHCDRKYACERTLIRHMKVVHKDIISKRLQVSDGDQANPKDDGMLYGITKGNDSQAQSCDKPSSS